MKKILYILAAAALMAAAASCSYERKSFTMQDAEVLSNDFAILAFVPQDAPAAFCLNECAAGLEKVYRKDPVDSLELGALAGAKAVLSFFQDGKLMPCLYVDCAAVDAAAVEEVMAAQAARGLKGKVLEKEGFKVLFLTPSDYAMANQDYSMASGKSILDAAGFADALANAPLAQGVTMFFNNKESAKMPKKVLAGEVSYQRLSAFMSGAAAWTVISDGDGKTYDVAPFTGGDAYYFLDVFSSIKPEASLIGEVMPGLTSFMIDVPVSSWKQLRRNVEAWQKARSKRPAAGTSDAIAWAKRVNPKEFAYIHFGRFKVVVVRAGARFKEHEPAQNPYPGAVAALLGNAFQLNDDSCFAVSGKWIVIGEEDAVRAFLVTNRKTDLPQFAGKDINYGVYRPGKSLWDEGGLIRLQFDK
jgi:hypothetical protein